MAGRRTITRRNVAVVLTALGLGAVSAPMAQAQSSGSPTQTQTVTQNPSQTVTQGNDHGANGSQQNQQTANCQAAGNCSIDQRSEQHQTVINNSNVTRSSSPSSAGTARRVVVERAVAAPVRPRVAVVRSVQLAHTGFNAWIPTALGVLSLALGLGLLAVRRWGLPDLSRLRRTP